MSRTVFEKSKWIWVASGECPDQYVEFCERISYRGGEVTVRLSCDGDYTLFANGRYVASNQYGDFEHYKIYDTRSLAPYLTEGENELLFLVHHVGASTFRYRPAAAGLLYEILAKDTPIAYSSEKTKSRQAPTYACGRQVFVSRQLGFTFFYDATQEGAGEAFAPSQTVEKNCTLFPRPIPKHAVLARHPMATLEKKSDTHYLIDLGGEAVGLPTLELDSDTVQTLTVLWGEHLVDGGLRKEIGPRNFYFAYTAKAGHTIFTEHMLRLGCRYLEVFSEKPIKLHYAGVLPQVYEVEELPYLMENELDRRIYDICLNTLRLCMMEHYVDCPWREQALYALDSRNQMLCGYVAFAEGNAAYARANLKLIGMDRREDGLLSICYPTGDPMAIPSFSLHYVIAMWEYLERTGDTTLSEELMPKMLGIIEEFLLHRRDGLVRKFPGAENWNFYDWSSFAEGTLRRAEPEIPDLFLNTLFLMALDRLERICRRLGHPFPYPGLSSAMRARIREEFLTEDGLFTVHAGRREYTSLGHALAILSGVATAAEAQAFCRRIASGELEDCSLSVKIFVYDALLDTDTDRYRDIVLDEIRKNYSVMLDMGCDTVWETLRGPAGTATSLCHGWSAIPIHVYHRLGMATHA